MATRSTIAIEHQDGTVQCIYCHWDGYLSHNGKILQEHYQDPAKVSELMELGDLSILGPEIGEQQDFDNPETRREDWCLAYGRDRGETGVSAASFQDDNDYLRNAPFQDYNYILCSDGVWYVVGGSYDGKLADYLERELVQC